VSTKVVTTPDAIMAHAPGQRRAKGQVRFFVVNSWQGKNGKRSRAVEYDTMLEATTRSDQMREELIRLTGHCEEDIYVFVGSKTALDRRIKA
jgi:hypothetical protein